MSLEFTSGAAVVAALRAAAAARGMPVTDFVRPVSASPANWLAMVGRARMPKPVTLDRARALIEGAPIPGIGTPGTIAALVRREAEETGARRTTARCTGAVANPIITGDRAGELMPGSIAPTDREPCFRCGVRGDIGCSHRHRHD